MSSKIHIRKWRMRLSTKIEIICMKKLMGKQKLINTKIKNLTKKYFIAINNTIQWWNK